MVLFTHLFPSASVESRRMNPILGRSISSSHSLHVTCADRRYQIFWSRLPGAEQSPVPLLLEQLDERCHGSSVRCQAIFVPLLLRSVLSSVGEIIAKLNPSTDNGEKVMIVIDVTSTDNSERAGIYTGVYEVEDAESRASVAIDRCVWMLRICLYVQGDGRREMTHLHAAQGQGCNPSSTPAVIPSPVRDIGGPVHLRPQS